jgi:predicted esterase
MKGKKTTITWMIAAALVAAVVVWRAAAGGGASDADGAVDAAGAADNVVEQQTPAVASERPATAPPPQPASTAPPTREEIRVQLRDPPPPESKLPGAWIDLPARSGAAAATVVALHGRGDTAHNFSTIARGFAPELGWRFIDAPLTYGRGKRWFVSDDVRRSGQPPARPLDLLEQHLRTLTGPVVLLGFSQGCMLLLHAVARGVPNVKAGVCIGGWSIGKPEFDVSAQVPVLFVNGSNDPVAKPELVREAIQLFENNHFATEQIEHAGAHTVPMDEAGRISEWMIRKAHGG